MQTFDFDLFVIGAGSGGVRASRIAAGYGAKVAIAEEHRFGGTCVIRGCVPKKLLMYASQFQQAFDDAAGFGWNMETPAHDWASLILAKDAEIDRLEAIYVRMLRNAGVETITGRARIVGPHRIEVNGVLFTARIILVATGSTPVRPAIPGADLTITSNEAFYLDALPRRIAILGGGYIACEFAGIFNGLDSCVTQLYRGNQILRGFDDELRDRVSAEVSKSGVDLRVGVDVVAVKQRVNGLAVHLSSGESIEVEAVMAATGRRSNASRIG